MTLATIHFIRDAALTVATLVAVPGAVGTWLGVKIGRRLGPKS